MDGSERSEDSWTNLGHWDDVSGGLRMYFAYAITLVVFVFLILAVSIAIGASGGMAALRSLESFTRIASILGVAVAVFGLLAIARYSNIHEATGARGTAKASLVLGVLSLVLSIVGIIGLFTGNTDLDEMTKVNVWDLLSRLLGVIQFFCFLSSLRTCAAFIGRFDLHAHAGTTMLLAGITIGMAVMAQLFGATNAAPLVLLLGLGVLGIGIWCFVYLLMLVRRLAAAVTRDAQLPGAFS